MSYWLKRLARMTSVYMSISSSGDFEMRRNLLLATLSLVFLFGGAATSSAQVKQVKMHIAGYLCGN
jgi:hypothetical protein